MVSTIQATRPIMSKAHRTIFNYDCYITNHHPFLDLLHPTTCHLKPELFTIRRRNCRCVLTFCFPPGADHHVHTHHNITMHTCSEWRIENVHGRGKQVRSAARRIDLSGPTSKQLLYRVAFGRFWCNVVAGVPRW
jgi:hypothetical protein